MQNEISLVEINRRSVELSERTRVDDTRVTHTMNGIPLATNVAGVPPTLLDEQQSTDAPLVDDLADMQALKKKPKK